MWVFILDKWLLFVQAHCAACMVQDHTTRTAWQSSVLTRVQTLGLMTGLRGAFGTVPPPGIFRPYPGYHKSYSLKHKLWRSLASGSVLNPRPHRVIR